MVLLNLMSYVIGSYVVSYIYAIAAVVAPPNHATFLWFQLEFYSFYSLIAETHIAYGRNTAISIGEDSRSIFRPSWPAWPP